MRFLKLLLLLVLILGLATGGLYVAEQRGLAPVGTFNNVTQRVLSFRPPTNIAQQLPQNTDRAVQFLTSQLQSASISAQVLGTSVGIEKTEPPLSQRAFEYARYSYCQEAIKDYEERNAK